MKAGSRAMKRLLFLGVGSAALVVMGGVGSAQADNGPHISTAATAVGTVTIGTASGAGRCAGCHRAHTAKASYLLKAAQPALCYSCHAAGMGADTDVKGGVDNTSGLALRAGGFESAAIDSSHATKEVYLSSGKLRGQNQVIPALALPAPTTSNHQIDGLTSGVAWGNGPVSANIGDTGKTLTLECGSCHDPHGNGNFRILKPIPTDAGTQVSHESLPAVLPVAEIPDDLATPLVNEFKAAVLAAPAVMSGTAGIKIPDDNRNVVNATTGIVDRTRTYTTTNYWLTGDANVPPTIGGVRVASPDGFIANVSDWCSTCHSRYLAKPGSWETPLVDAAGVKDANFTYRHTSNRIDKVGTRNCITCHVAHGSNAAMSSTAASFTAPDGTTPTKNSRLLRVDNRGTCVLCHNY